MCLDTRMRSVTIAECSRQPQFVESIGESERMIMSDTLPFY